MITVRPSCNQEARVGVHSGRILKIARMKEWESRGLGESELKQVNRKQKPRSGRLRVPTPRFWKPEYTDVF